MESSHWVAPSRALRITCLATPPGSFQLCPALLRRALFANRSNSLHIFIRTWPKQSAAAYKACREAPVAPWHEPAEFVPLPDKANLTRFSHLSAEFGIPHLFQTGQRVAREAASVFSYVAALVHKITNLPYGGRYQSILFSISLAIAGAALIRPACPISASGVVAFPSQSASKRSLRRSVTSQVS